MTTSDITVERVGPKKAERWLNGNTNNRSLRSGVVEQYADDMRNGRWTRCTAPIVFYVNGDLGDGQHRLYAVIESDTEQEFTVHRNLPLPAGLNIDTGLGRTVVDNGRISGLDPTLSTNLVATARAVAHGSITVGRISPAAKLALVAEHREACEWALSKVPHVRNICNGTVLGAMARAWYYEKNLDRLAEYGQIIATGFGNGEPDSAAIAMRNYLLQNAGVATSSAMWRDTFLKVQNSISYFMKGRKLTVIKGVKDDVYPLKKPKSK